MNTEYRQGSLQEESEVPGPMLIEGGHRARAAWRAGAKTGTHVQLVKSRGDGPENYLVAVNGLAIGMLQRVALCLDSQTGLTLALSWPREAQLYPQEWWEVGTPTATTITTATGVRHGIQVTLLKDLHEDHPVDAELLLDVENDD